MGKRILCFGELLLRLGAPGREPLLQTRQLQVHVGGAEANVAVSLARFGHDSAFAGTVADNALGEAALGELRRHGVDVSRVRRVAGRMGLYFLATGAGLRPSDVVYDRADSAFARAAPDSYDWQSMLDGIDCLHVSGVTAAVGPTGAQAAAEAFVAARARGALASFDGNFRPKLWATWNDRPAPLLHALLAQADIAFIDHRDVDLVLGPANDKAALPAAERTVAAAARAFAHFPHLQRIACTQREVRSVDAHTLGALLVHRDGTVHRIDPLPVEGIVDRIGGGDAFAAGVLHGVLSGMADAQALAFGLGAARLKHSVPGDFNLVGPDDVAALVDSGRLDVRR
ncbi:sugar kinase [Luteimonas sp. FCS-9]|uniref:sugar kinase n=1 Tax=Luteimonas sp. FCS-9 TaxID=1547516 RepID=UPI00063EC7F8|nr:sugar kinase [Luteimonas sp. FCS-9]KLJ00170.1 2-keto-3-deoxygluconate kinase [Luteimonas sp. FCS-9]